MQEGGIPTLHVGIIMDGNGRWASARGWTVSTATRAARAG